jgi:hypothetical protein
MAQRPGFCQAGEMVAAYQRYTEVGPSAYWYTEERTAGLKEKIPLRETLEVRHVMGI